MAKLEIAETVFQPENTRILRSMKLSAKNQGDQESAVVSAAYYAKKLGHTMYVYVANSYMSAVYNVSDKPSEYLNTSHNMSSVIWSVTPELEMFKHGLAKR